MVCIQQRKSSRQLISKIYGCIQKIKEHFIKKSLGKYQGSFSIKFLSFDDNIHNNIEVQIKVKTIEELKKTTSFFKNFKNINISLE